ncbi:hypothetical protein EVAR_53641_1 [Eumeta japonica]|uniref:DUF4371 domain-containing protein n=1 Tax=Eumeta variegata TaxID=151549 RepID=A0A4C1YJJ7_EUMVA|nr:hypothetical protein EVAR_53641_1 [Eumeta japonica]
MHLEQCSSTQNSVFSGLSSDIQNDLIKSIAQVIRDEIKSEINFAKFVSVIADETPDISHREQMSVIFRYLTKTGIEERFVGTKHLTRRIKKEHDPLRLTGLMLHPRDGKRYQTDTPTDSFTEHPIDDPIGMIMRRGLK